MSIIAHRKIFFAIAAALVGASVFAVSFFGLRFGIEFTGGALLEITYTDARPELSDLEKAADALRGETGDVVFQETGEKGLLVRVQKFDAENTRAAFLDALSLSGVAPFEEERFSFIGPTIGKELAGKALTALALVAIGIVLFIAFAFRQVSKPVSSWKYGVIAIAALVHDVAIPVGVFAVLGAFYPNFQVDVLFVTALLVILGYSVNDTIVVFDRIRENLRREGKDRDYADFDFETLVGQSVTQTIARSVNTGLTTLFVLIALFALGGAPTAHFALTLIIGVIAGTYSSIFLAAPLLVSWGLRRKE